MKARIEREACLWNAVPGRDDDYSLERLVIEQIDGLPWHPLSPWYGFERKRRLHLILKALQKPCQATGADVPAVFVGLWDEPFRAEAEEWLNRYAAKKLLESLAGGAACDGSEGISVPFNLARRP